MCAMLWAMKNYLPHISKHFLPFKVAYLCIAVVTTQCLAIVQFASAIEGSLPSNNTLGNKVNPPTSEVDPDSISHTTDQVQTDTDKNDIDEDDNYPFESDLIIKAVNPGYTQDRIPHVGEFIELQNLTDDTLELAGYSLVYTGSGKPNLVFTFPEGSLLASKHLLMRYVKSPEQDFDLTYKVGTVGLAQSAGKLELFYNNEVVDALCWSTKSTPNCVQKPANSTETMVRNLASGDFDLVSAIDYETPSIDPDVPNLFLPENPDDTESPEDELAPQCRGLEFSELLTYYTEDKSEQFIEFFNPTNQEIILNGCKIAYKNKTYELSGRVASGNYYAFYQSQLFALTKNPQNPLALTLLDTDGEVLDEISYSNGQKKSTSFAKIFDENGNGTWQVTYAITPNSENVFQKFRTCEAGKIINEATGNCVKVTSLKTTAETLQSKLKTSAPCPAGKYRNPLTGRCKNIETTSSALKACAEGYERNPETNRCRKIKNTTPNDGADYALTTKASSGQTVFVGIGIVSIIILLGMVYVVLQFRHEIVRAARKARQRINRIFQDSLTRKIGRNRNQKP